MANKTLAKESETDDALTQPAIKTMNATAAWRSAESEMPGCGQAGILLFALVAIAWHQHVGVFQILPHPALKVPPPSRGLSSRRGAGSGLGCRILVETFGHLALSAGWIVLDSFLLIVLSVACQKREGQAEHQQ